MANEIIAKHINLIINVYWKGNCMLSLTKIDCRQEVLFSVNRHKYYVYSNWTITKTSLSNIKKKKTGKQYTDVKLNLD